MRLFSSRSFVNSLPDFPDADLFFVAPVGSTNDVLLSGVLPDPLVDVPNSGGDVPNSGGDTRFSGGAASLSGSAHDFGEFTVVVSDEQVGGRGRLGRSWSSAKSRMFAISVLLNPKAHGVPMEKLSWLPLLGGLAVAEALEAALQRMSPIPVSDKTFGVKWPNDVMTVADNKKICGVLSELNANGTLVIGAGINLLFSESELPVDTATSLLVEIGKVAGADVGIDSAGGSDVVVTARADAETFFDAVLREYLSRLLFWYRKFLLAEGDASISGLADAVRDGSVTIGQEVRVIVSGQEDRLGRAVGIGPVGELLFREDVPGSVVEALMAADVTHLRRR